MSAVVEGGSKVVVGGGKKGAGVDPIARMDIASSKNDSSTFKMFMID